MRDIIRNVPLFADLPDPLIAELCESSPEVRLEPGEELFPQGAAGNSAFVIMEGQLEVIRNEAGAEVLQAVRGPGEVIGEMALVEGAPRAASVRARTAATLIEISRDQFDHLLETSPAAARTIFRTVLVRWRETEQNLRLSQKLAALGTQTAGLVHEINNPTAAIRASAVRIPDVVQQLLRAGGELAPFALAEDQRTLLGDLAQRAHEAAQSPRRLESLERADRESMIDDWLAARGLDDSWELAPALVNLGFEVPDLEALSENREPALFAAILRYLVAVFTLCSLAVELMMASERLAGLVAAVKGYTHLDEAPVQRVDVNRGLEDTLVILRHKLKGASRCVGELAPDLPQIEAYASELNQVWTNLIDNAADAAGPGGVVTVRSQRQDDSVVVEIQDNGPGIADVVRERIFDPFFTTKPQGQGTGLGLPTVYNIVVNKHRGAVEVESVPGLTVFRVRLPARLGGR